MPLPSSIPVHALLFGALLLSAKAGENLIEDGAFEAKAWKGNAWEGTGTVSLSSESPAEGATCLHLEGNTPEVHVQAYSGEIPVSPGSTYLLDCQYRTSEARATVELRWKSKIEKMAGVVFKINTPSSNWTSLLAGVSEKEIAAILYTEALGSGEMKFLPSNSVTIPEDISTVSIYVTMAGKGSLDIDSVSFVQQ